MEQANNQRPWLLRKLHSERYSLSRRVTVEAAVMDFKIASLAPSDTKSADGFSEKRSNEMCLTSSRLCWEDPSDPS